MKNRGADVLIRTLADAGVRRIFTVSGNHIMPVFDAALDAGIELIHARHEAAAVHMADASTRISGDIGVALVTGGPGHANAVSALFTALLAESPVLFLSGHAPTREIGMGAFQEMRQADIAAPVTKAAWTCASAGALAGDVARAIRVAQSGRPGPVHVSLPVDALEGDASATAVPATRDLGASPIELDPQTGDALLRRLRGASRPMILVGPTGLTRRGRALAAALEDAAGIPVVGMESPRGMADPSLGAFAEMLAQADCVLLLGKAPRLHVAIRRVARIRHAVHVPADRRGRGRARALAPRRGGTPRRCGDCGHALGVANPCAQRVGAPESA